MFTWNQVSLSCPAVYYNINASGCGICRNTIVTTSNYVMCNITTLSLPQTCSLTVQTVVCGMIDGRISEPVTVLLKGWLYV